MAIVLSQASRNIKENAETCTVLVKLGSQPMGNGEVVLDISSADTSEFTVLKEQLVFDTLDWANPKHIKVRAVEDNVADGNKRVKLTASLNTSLSTIEDASYRSPLSGQADIEVIDLDSPAFLLDQKVSQVHEKGGRGEFSLSLTKQPLEGEVVVANISSLSGKLNIPTNQVVFDSNNRNAIHVISLEAPSDYSSNTSEEVNISISSNMTEYPISNRSLSFSVIDLDTPQILIEADQDYTSENGELITIKVRLTGEPTDNVKVNCSLAPSNEADLSVRQLEFPAQENDGVQYLYIRGKDDDFYDGLKDITLLLDSDESNADSDYLNLSADYQFVNYDNENAGLIIDTFDTDHTVEYGKSRTLSFHFSSPPSDTVTLPISLSSSTEASLGGLSLLAFNQSNNYRQTIAITGVDDELLDGHQEYQIQLGDLISEDSKYDGLQLPDIRSLNYDDEGTGLLIWHAGEFKSEDDIQLNIYEGMNQDTFRLALSSAPAGNIIVNISSSDPDIAEVTPHQVVLDSKETSLPITVTGHKLTSGLSDKNFSITITVDEASTHYQPFAFQEYVLEGSNQAAPALSIVDNKDFIENNGEHIIDLISFSSEFDLEVLNGSAPYSWTIYDDYGYVTSSLSEDTSALTVNPGAITGTYSVNVIDSQNPAESASYSFFLQGSPLVTHYINNSSSGVLELYFEDLLASERSYIVYALLNGNQWTALNQTPLEPSLLARAKPGLDSLMVSVFHDGSDDMYFKLRAVDAQGNMSPDIPDEFILSGKVQPQYEVQESNQMPLSNFESGGGGCLLE
ncbi:MAG: hypothetical protein HQL32_03140 [Planctomycetes bacterium]|nr:hypothetical protein [Planctomycetota bacterium]